jgi:Glycosyltransferase 61
VDSVDQEVIWGGYLSTHYGHFLTESVSRLWATLPDAEMEGRPVVFAAPRQQPSFVGEWLNAFGLQPQELPSNGTVLFRKMAVPEPAWRLNAWIAPEIRRIHLQARRRMNIPSFDKGDMLWLSRQGLGPGRTAHDEHLLEWILREHVRTICPERLSLSEQLGLIESNRIVAGIVGSAFHTLLLAETTPQCICLCPRTVASAYAAQEELVGMPAALAWALEPIPIKDRSRVRFPAGFRVMIPEALRALTSMVPELASQTDIKAILEPEGVTSSTSHRRDLISAIARVAHDPHSVVARLALGERFEAEDNNECAAEQFRAVAEMSAEHATASLQARRHLERIGA